MRRSLTKYWIAGYMADNEKSWYFFEGDDIMTHCKIYYKITSITRKTSTKTSKVFPSVHFRVKLKDSDTKYTWLV